MSENTDKRDGLLLGSFYNAIDTASLKQMGVCRVVNMCGEPRMAPPLSSSAVDPDESETYSSLQSSVVQSLHSKFA